MAGELGVARAATEAQGLLFLKGRGMMDNGGWLTVSATRSSLQINRKDTFVSVKIDFCLSKNEKI